MAAFRFRLAAFAAAMTLCLSACDNGKKPSAAPVEAILKGRRFELTVLASEKDRRGAMERMAALPPGRAALLAWPRARALKLETERARAAFDAAFLDLSGRIVDHRSLSAGDPEGIVPAADAAYALLLPEGTLRVLDVRIGDAANLPATAPQELPEVRIGDSAARVELALTETERQHGLMFRPRLSPDDGMLFAYDSDAPRGFWMGNTLIPLDIAFFHSDGTLLNVVETPPYPDPRRPPADYAMSRSSAPARFVLEMNLGWFRRHGLVDEKGIPKPGLRAVFPPEALGGF